jgi:AcrR family transcriptional regulator
MNVRDAILDATVRVFGEAGFRGATTRRIAQEAGVNEVTLFRHFGSKEKLLQEALCREGRVLAVPPLPDRPIDPERELTEWCHEHMIRLNAAAPLIRTCMGEFEERPEVSARGCEGPTKVATELRQYLERLQDGGWMNAGQDTHAAAAMLMGAIFSDAVSRDLMPERYPYGMEEAAGHYVGIFLRGIAQDETTEIGEERKNDARNG